MTSKQHYVLPVETIIETMKESPFLIQLQTCLSSLPHITTEVCIAELIVGQGKMHVCKITTSTGHLLLEHEEAITHLQQCGSVEWSLLPMAHLDLLLQTAPALPETSSSSTSFALGIPLRCVYTLTGDQMQVLSHGQMHVFALVDGVKTVEHIARLLSKSPLDVQRVLQTLQNMYLISL